MKILVTITTGFTLVGGLASVMMNYYRVLTKTNLNIDFCCSNEPPQVLLDEIHANGSEYYQLPNRKNVLAYFFALKQLCRGYDAIHVHANSATAVIELQAARWAGIKKRIIHNHSSR